MAVKLALRKQLEKTLLSIPTPKPLPEEPLFVPNLGQGDFVLYCGLDMAVQKVGGFWGGFRFYDHIFLLIFAWDRSMEEINAQTLSVETSVCFHVRVNMKLTHSNFFMITETLYNKELYVQFRSLLQIYTTKKAKIHIFFLYIFLYYSNKLYFTSSIHSR